MGRIDIVAIDREGQFVVIELKLGRGSDVACGQLLRYISWVKRHISGGARVRGIVVAERIDDRLKYATADLVGIRLLEYSLSMTVRDVDPL